MADYNISIKITPMGLDGAIKNLQALDTVSNKATQSITGLVGALNNLKKIDLSQFNNLFALAIASCQGFEQRLTQVNNLLDQLANRTGEVSNQFENLSDNSQDASQNIERTRESCIGLNAELVGMTSALQLAQTAFSWTKNFVNGSIQARSYFQTLERQLGAVLGSAEAVNEELPKLRKMANTTPNVDTEGAVKGVATFMRMGNTIDEARHKMETLANATAFYGGTVENVKLALVQFEQMANKDSGWGEDIRSLTNHLPGIRDLIRQKFGTIDPKELKELGITSGKQLVEGIFEAMGEINKVDGGISEQFSQLQDNIMQIRADIGEQFLPAFNKAVELVGQFSNIVKNLPEGIKSFVSQSILIGGAISGIAVGTVALTKFVSLIKQGILEIKTFSAHLLGLSASKNKDAMATEKLSLAQATFNVEMEKAKEELATANTEFEKLCSTEMVLSTSEENLNNLYNQQEQALERLIQAEERVNQLKKEGISITNSSTASIEANTSAIEANTMAQNSNNGNGVSGTTASGNNIGEDIALGSATNFKGIKGALSIIKRKGWKDGLKILKRTNAGKLGKFGTGARIGFSLLGNLAGDWLTKQSDQMLEDQIESGEMHVTPGEIGASVTGNAVKWGSNVAMFTKNPYLIGGAAILGAAVGGGIHTKKRDEAWKTVKKNKLTEQYTNVINWQKENNYNEWADRNANQLDYLLKTQDINLKYDKQGNLKHDKNYDKWVEAYKEYQNANNEITNKYKEQNQEQDKAVKLKEKLQNYEILATQALQLGNEYQAQRIKAQAEYESIIDNEKATEKDKLLALEKYNLTLQKINEEEQKHTIELEKQAIIQKGQLDSKKAELSGNGKYSSVITAQAEYDAIMRDPIATQHDKEMAGLNLAGAKNSAHISEIREEGALLSAQAEYYGDTKMAKNISAWYEYQSVVQDVTKSNKEKIAEWFKYQSKLMQNEIDEFKKAINEKKKLIDDIIRKREQQTNSVISEIEKERNAMSNYKELGQQAYLTSAYFDTSLVPEQYSRDEIMRANARVDMRKQIDENKKSQVDFALYGNTTNQLKDSQKSIENMEKNISQFNITGQQLLYVMQQVLGGVNNVSGILAYESRKSMA
ncbi:MAG: tape measure protein [Abditibacteriota bacterium]|nr:tape measure protein [Abditibacteriota bacterium]